MSPARTTEGESHEIHGSDFTPSAGGLDSPSWVAVWTRSRHEEAVQTRLTRIGVETFLPAVPRWSRWKDRTKQIRWPLFPGYCFARVASVQCSNVMRTSGVVTILCCDGKPAPIPDHEIAAVRLLLQSALDFDMVSGVREGTLVEVLAGPLQGVVGRLVRKTNRARLVLSVDLIGKGVSIEVDAHAVRPCATAS